MTLQDLITAYITDHANVTSTANAVTQAQSAAAAATAQLTTDTAPLARALQSVGAVGVIDGSNVDVYSSSDGATVVVSEIPLAGSVPVPTAPAPPTAS